MKNSGFVLTRNPNDTEKQELNRILAIDNPSVFWSGVGDIVFWDNNLSTGDLNGLIGKTFSESETINYL